LKIRWLSYGLLILAVSAVQARDQLVIDATLDTEASTISGSASFDIGDKGVDLTDLRFRLYPNFECADSAACGIHIDSMKVDGVNLSAGIISDGTDMYVPLVQPISAPEHLNAQVWFTTGVPGHNDRLGFAHGQYTLTGWFPMLAPWRDQQWQKIAYREFLEPAADLLDIEAKITFSDSLELIAPGISGLEPTEGMTTAQIRLEASSGVPLFFATRYNLDSTTVLNTALKLYYRESDRYAVDTVRAAATATIEYMSDYVLPYPFDELVIVIGGLSAGGGLEQPRMILASPPPRATGNSFYTSMIIHEVIHQWFYGIVNSDQARAPWLDEAVTEYLSLKIGHYRAQGSPDLFAVFGMTANHLSMNRMAARPFMETDAITCAGDRFYDQATYYRTVYSKGTLVLKTLAGIMGEERERLFWREYADSFMYATPEPDDFVRIANKYLPVSESADARTILDHTSSTDFVILSLGTEIVTAPSDSTERISEDSLVWEATIEYLAQHPLGFPVDLRVEFLDGTVIDTVLNPTPGRHKIEYTTPSPAVAAIIDPEYKYAIDSDYLNNSLTQERSRGAALRLFSGVTFLVESLFSSLWGW
jgi:peptidase M1-like protein